MYWPVSHYISAIIPHTFILYLLYETSNLTSNTESLFGVGWITIDIITVICIAIFPLQY